MCPFSGWLIDLQVLPQWRYFLTTICGQADWKSELVNSASLQSQWSHK